MKKRTGARDTCFVGSQVWVQVPDESRVFELGEVTHISHEHVYSVETRDGKTLEVSQDAVKVTHENTNKVVEDLLDLGDYSEESLLYMLRERYTRDEFYTMVGPILISINPYKWCDIYSSDRMRTYRGKRRPQVAPHVFLTAENAYRAVVEDPERSSQAIIISGESGAGKTEATKIIMRYLSTAGRQDGGASKSPDSTATVGVEQRVLDSNPLLEAFGNAKTLRNDNSSRFGKFIEIQLETTGLISGARVVNYLLEKSRIIRQTEGERNYHVFYQMLRGADQELLASIGLKDMMEDDFDYVSTGTCLPLFEENDVTNFARTVECFESIGVREGERHSLWRVLAGVLLLGNVNFEEVEDVEGCTGCTAEPEFVARAATALGLEAEALSVALSTHKVQVGRETYLKPILPGAARDKRDALAKALYALVFRWLVMRINASLSGHAAAAAGAGGGAPGGSGASAGAAFRSLKSFASMQSMDADSDVRFIGILDIYGFEVFEDNSFEQFCINFANEKLQRHFNKYIFEVEQEEYAKEGIDWSRIEFNDNQPCLDLIDTGRHSLLCLLDEECIMPKGSDLSLLRKLHTNHKDRHPHYVHSRFGSDTTFGVRHYAGTVEYAVEGFIAKNNDSLSEELSSLMQRSSETWIKHLFPAPPGSGGDGGGGSGGGGGGRNRRRLGTLRAPTVSQQFRKQLESLLKKLESCKPHFVRCVKPNDIKAPGIFHSLKCVQQLRYAGMLETIRIRDSGYSLREKHDNFFRRFRLLAPMARDCTALVDQISAQFGLDDASQWQVGHTKVFLRRELAELLDRTAGVRQAAASRTIARAFKETILRKKKGAVLVIEAFYDRVRFVLVLRKVMQMQCAVRMRLARLRAKRRREEIAKLPEEVKPDLAQYAVPDLKAIAEKERKAKQAAKQRTAPISPKAGRTKQSNKTKEAPPPAPATPPQAAAPPPPPPVSDALREELEDLRRKLTESTHREKLATRRVVDCQSFVDAMTGGDADEDKEGPNDLEAAIDSLLASVKRGLRRIKDTVSESANSASASAAAAEAQQAAQLRQLLQQQHEMMQQTLQEQRGEREGEVSRRVETLEEQLEVQRGEMDRMRAQLGASREEVLVQKQHVVRLESALEMARAESLRQDNDLRDVEDQLEGRSNRLKEALAEVASRERELHALRRESAAQREELEMQLANARTELEEVYRKHVEPTKDTSELDYSVSKLMRENVALLDEVLDTRTRHQGLVRKLQKSESRAAQAEAANETLVTLLAWRDNQLAAVLQQKEPRFTDLPDVERLEAQIRELRPYIEQVSSNVESKLDDAEHYLA